MSSDKSLGVNLIGRDVSASKALKKVADSAKETGSSFSKIKEIAAGIFSAQALEAGAKKIVDFAKESMNAFVDVGKEVAKTQRMVGGTVEEASKLRFAFEESGLSVDKAQMSIKKFAQAIDSNNKHFKELNISTRDSAGHQKSFNDILLDTAEKFKHMPNGINKTAMAVNLFGRTGLDMLKFLNKGKTGLQELEDEAQKYGLVLTKDNMEAISQNIEAHKKLHAAVSGLQVQIGAHITPALTKMTVAFTKIFPILLKYVNPAFREIGKFLSPIIAMLKNFATSIITLAKHFILSSSSMSKFHDIGKNLGIVFKVLFDFIKNTWIPVLKAVWTFIFKYIGPVFLFLVDIISKVLVVAIKIAVTSIRFLITVIRDVIGVARAVAHVIANVFKFIVNGVKAYINTIIGLINFVIGIINKLHFKIPSWVPKFGGKEFGVTLPKIPMLADGGIVNKPTLAMIGEAGPEAVVPLKGGFGNGMIVNVHVAGSVIAEKDLAVKVRNEMAQLLRRKGLNPAILGV